MTGDGLTPNEDSLRLDHFLKQRALLGTGGQAKMMIQNGEVKVNGETEIRRRRKVSAGDVVEVGNKKFVVGQADSGK